MTKLEVTIVLIIVWVFNVFFVSAQTSIVTLNEKNIILDLWGKTSVEYLEDTSHKLTLSHLIKNSSLIFKSSLLHSPDFGFTDADYWIRFRVQKQTNEPISWVLQNNYPMIVVRHKFEYTLSHLVKYIFRSLKIRSY